LKQLKVRGADLEDRKQSEVNAAKQSIADDLLSISKELQREPKDENDMTHVEYLAWQSKQKNQKSVAKDNKSQKAIKSAGKNVGKLRSRVISIVTKMLMIREKKRMTHRMMTALCIYR
jgi:hypothetical protein